MPMLYARLYCETCNTKHDHILGAHNKPQPHECPDCHKHLITSRMARYRDCVKLNTKQARERLKRQEEVWARMWDGFSEKAIVVRIAQLMQHPNIPHAYAIFEKPNRRRLGPFARLGNRRFLRPIPVRRKRRARLPPRSDSALGSQYETPRMAARASGTHRTRPHLRTFFDPATARNGSPTGRKPTNPLSPHGRNEGSRLLGRSDRGELLAPGTRSQRLTVTSNASHPRLSAGIPSPAARRG